jgi:hypothetical protein
VSTDYFLDNIDLQNGAKTTLTAVCFPDGFKSSDKANLIVYFHGTDQSSIKDYLTAQTEHDLRAELDAASPTKSVVLIAPTLSTDARGGKLGGEDQDLIPSDGLQWYLPLVYQELQKKKPKLAIPDFSKADSINQIVLAAHSGGGKVMLALARTIGGNDDFAKKITELWGFDCVYGQGHGPRSIPSATPDLKASQKDWIDWESKHRSHREMLWAEWASKNTPNFFLYCASGPKGGGTKVRSTNLKNLATRKNLSNVDVTFDAAVSHDGIVRPRFAERLKALTI